MCACVYVCVCVLVNRCNVCFLSLFCRNHTIPSKTLPNTTCFPSSHGALAKVMKNCEPLVSGPAFAMLTHPVPRCLQPEVLICKRASVDAFT